MPAEADLLKGSMVCLTTPQGCRFEQLCRGRYATWSADGSKIGYCGARSNGQLTVPSVYEIKSRRVCGFPDEQSDSRLFWTAGGQGFVYYGTVDDPPSPVSADWFYLPLQSACRTVVEHVLLYEPEATDFAVGMRGTSYACTEVGYGSRGSMRCRLGFEPVFSAVYGDELHISAPRRPAWHPEKPLLLFDDKGSIYRMDVARRETRLIWRPPTTGDLQGYAFSAVYSLDGKSIAFVLRSGTGTSSIVCVDSNGEHVGMVARGVKADPDIPPAREVPFAWGPDSRSIVFTAQNGEMRIASCR